ncbi:MAG: lipoprotein signal peptidase [Bacteroidales bacterium]|nr:lipoprotein signal peptidase [Bacteroidales bacterium]
MDKTIKKKSWICIGIIALMLVIDQVVKIWIKTTLPIGGDIPLIGEWCRLHFVENEGIAFGVSFGDSFGKAFLTLFRLVASVVIVFILIRQLKKNAPYSLLISITLILVGAVGNLVDSCFYGVIFNESTYDQVATLFPDGGGYAGFLFGKVVDMFYFPMFHWTWPDWVPAVGGQSAEFFNAIFNVADSCVCVGVALLIIDQLWLHPEKSKEQEEESVTNEV